MRVALACPYAWDAPGGVQTHVRQLASHLERRGHQVMITAPAFDTKRAAGIRVAGRPWRIPYNGSIAPVCPDPRSRRVIRRALAEFRADVVHVHEPLTPSTGMFATLESRVPVVATFHAYAGRSILMAALAPLLGRVWRRLSVRLAVSEAAAEFAGRHLTGELTVVPNGVDVDLFGGARPAELPPGRRILFVNRLEPRKGFAVAVRAFVLLAEEVPDAILVVAGDGPERSAAEELPAALRDRVLMLGTVSHDRLPPYHAAADLFIGPAVGGESFGIVLVEAMAAGLPVVASDIPGYREVVRDGTDGLLVPPKDPAALASSVRRILADPRLANRLRTEALASAERYRWEVVTAQIEDAYLAATGT